MHDAEMKQLAMHQQTAERQVSHAFYLALGIVAFAFVAGGVGFALTLFGRRSTG